MHEMQFTFLVLSDQSKCVMDEWQPTSSDVPMRPNEVHEMHFVFGMKYILRTSFCGSVGIRQCEVHFMYHIFAIRFKEAVFYVMRYMKCTSSPFFAPIRPNEVHEMHFVNGMKYILRTSFCGSVGIRQCEVHFMHLIFAFMAGWGGLRCMLCTSFCVRNGGHGFAKVHFALIRLRRWRNRADACALITNGTERETSAAGACSF